jgi:bifunctional ADP-heptose synthase (sugar kinase/adenylyltransferase)
MNKDIVEAESVLKAERLSEYFTSMAKKIKSSSLERGKVKMNINPKASNYENYQSIIKDSPNMIQKDIAELLNVSERQIRRFAKKLEEKANL